MVGLLADRFRDDPMLQPGKSLIVAGPGQPANVHAIAHALNAKLENIGKTVLFMDPPLRPANAKRGPDGLNELAKALRSGDVELLVILGGNPAYAAPADLQFADKIGKAKLSVHLGLYRDETAERCHWHIPEAHYLESWGDARAFDGTASVVQPLIAPLYGGRIAIDLLSALADEAPRAAYDLVRGLLVRLDGEERGGRGFRARLAAGAQRRRCPETVGRRAGEAGPAVEIDVGNQDAATGQAEMARPPDGAAQTAAFGYV